MVRVKNRYLLVNILYPTEIEKPGSDSRPCYISLNQPTTDKLTPQILLRAIRAAVAELFGDYGAGATKNSLSGIVNLAL
jgi:ribonuclease P/MRP protein subunit POP5